jgi:hypothetical protein
VTAGDSTLPLLKTLGGGSRLRAAAFERGSHEGGDALCGRGVAYARTKPQSGIRDRTLRERVAIAMP